MARWTPVPTAGGKKAADVTQSGAYWLTDSHGTRIVQVSVEGDDTFFEFVRDEDVYSAAAIGGYLTGPIAPPSA